MEVRPDQFQVPVQAPEAQLTETRYPVESIETVLPEVNWIFYGKFSIVKKMLHRRLTLMITPFPGVARVEG